MKHNDQIAIFESYRDDILNKFKQSAETENEPEMSEIEKIDDIDSPIDMDNDLDDDEPAPVKKKNVIVKSQEVGVNLGSKLREIVRYMPPTIEDVDVLQTIKRAVQRVNDKFDLEGDDKINDTPLSIYDELINSGVYSEEEVVDDSDDEKSQDIEDDLFSDDDYFSDEDFTGEKEFDVSSKSRKERGDDFRSGMRKDVERSKAEEILRQMGVDFENRSDFDDDY
jgi:hypothetical protein